MGFCHKSSDSWRLPGLERVVESTIGGGCPSLMEKVCEIDIHSFWLIGNQLGMAPMNFGWICMDSDATIWLELGSLSIVNTEITLILVLLHPYWNDGSRIPQMPRVDSMQPAMNWMARRRLKSLDWATLLWLSWMETYISQPRWGCLPFATRSSFSERKNNTEWFSHVKVLKFQGLLPPMGVDAKSLTVFPGLGRQVRGHRCRNVLWLGLTLCFGSTPERSGANSRRRWKV